MRRGGALNVPRLGKFQALMCTTRKDEFLSLKILIDESLSSVNNIRSRTHSKIFYHSFFSLAEKTFVAKSSTPMKTFSDIFRSFSNI